MIEPNFNLMLWILFIIYSLKSVSQIILGITRAKKDLKYGSADVVAGIIALILMLVVLLI